MDTGLRREAIRTMLVRRTGSACDASVIAETTIDIWHQMAARLAPVIGARGVDVLFNRALHQTSTAFSWLPVTGGHEGSVLRLTSLKTHLAGQETATALQGSSALLSTVTELLANLIGESLTERLLYSIWTPPSPVSEQESTS